MTLDLLVQRSFGTGARLRPGHGPGAIPYLMVSGASGPRWLVPAEPSPVSIAAVGTWRPHGVAAAIKWRAFAVAWRTSMAGALPGVERVSIAGADGYRTPAIHIGTPDRRQKAILFDAAPGGTGIVRKIAMAPDAEAAVAHEAAILDRLAGLCPGLAPPLLEAEVGHVSMGWLDGDPVSPKLDEPVLAMLAALRLDGELETVGEPGLPDRLPAFVEHGDFAPWNLRRHRGALHALDWEDARIPGLPLQDLVGWCLAVGFVLRRRPVADVLRDARPVLQAFASRIGLDDLVVGPLVAHYVARRRQLARERGDEAYEAALASAIDTQGAWT